MLEGRTIDWLVRVASHNIIISDKERAAKKAKQEAESQR
jgi:hypothetical protein